MAWQDGSTERVLEVIVDHGGAMLAKLLQNYSKRHSRRNLYEWLQETVTEYHLSEARETLSIGAGGAVASQLHQAGVHPLEIDNDSSRAPDRVVDVQDMSCFEDSRFDAIFLLEVLEHVAEPRKAITELYRVLKPGGVFIGSTPFLLGIHDHPHDYFRFTRFGLSLLFSAFEQKSLRERNGYFDSINVLCLRLFNIGSREQIRAAIVLSPVLLALGPLFWLLGRILKSRDGTTGYFFVYRKPSIAV